MRLFLLMVTWLLFLQASWGQGFNASWYHPQQPYVKIAVIEDGVHRVTGEQLNSLGIDITSITPSTLQLFESGKEIPLYVDNTTALNPANYIEFIGKRNTGKDETWAFEAPEAQSSAYYSLYTDTTFYWLTWNQQAGLRYTNTSPTQYSNGALPITTYRSVTHREEEKEYYYGDGANQPGNPMYTRSEGFQWINLTNNNTNPVSNTQSLTLQNPTNLSTDTLIVTVKVSAGNSLLHKIALEVETNDGSGATFKPFDLQEWAGYDFALLTAKIPQNELAQQNQVRVKVISYNDSSSERPRIYLDWMEASYMRLLSFPSATFSFDASFFGHIQYDITDVTTPLTVYEPLSQKRFVLSPESGTVSFSDNVQQPQTRYFATTATEIKSPVALQRDVSSDWANPTNQADYLILTTKMLMPSALEMASYRQTKSGFTVAVVDVQDIFDQFDYGRRTPIAIRRFIHQSQQWQRKPRFLLIWGDTYYTNRSKANPDWEVPSFGIPSSDGWFGMQYQNEYRWSEVLAIGRVNVRTNEAGTDIFIPKLRTYESTPPASWNKNMMTLSGGYNLIEQASLRSHVLRWATQMSTFPVGMNTTHVQSNLTDAIDTSQVDSLRSHLETGIGWMTYFGHSSAYTWQISTDEPELWNNSERLPVVLSLGCVTGAFGGDLLIGRDQPVFAEQLLLNGESGAIAHWGGAGNSFISFTARLTDEVFKTLSQDTLRTLGAIFQKAKQQYITPFGNTVTAQTYPFETMHLLMYNLVGDPATQVVIPNQTNLHIEPENITISPPTPVPADETLTVSVTIDNYGTIPTQNTTVTVTHTTPNNASFSYSQEVAPFALEQTILFTIPIDDASVGENTFHVTIDANNVLAEKDETDNFATKNHYVFSNGLSSICPNDFGIAESLPTLRVSSFFEVQHPIVFELDTTPTFDSANKQSFQTTLTDLKAEWIISNALEEGKTYYWRAKIDDPTQAENWEEGRFTVKQSLAQGWFQQNELFEANINENAIDYKENAWAFDQYDIEVIVNSERGGGEYKGQFEVNGERIERLHIGYAVLVLDGYSGVIKDHTSKTPYPNPWSDYQKDWQDLKAFINEIKNGDLVFLNTRNFGTPADLTIPDSVKALFRGLGSTAIDTLDYGDLWTFATRKGFPDETTELAGYPPGSADLRMTLTYPFNTSNGTSSSPLIGPAMSWQTVTWQQDFPVADPNRKIVLEVLDPNGNILLTKLEEPSPPIDISQIDATQYPKIQLRATIQDSSHATTPQLLNWYVGYEPVAELALASESFTFSADTLLEGQNLTATIKAYNLSKNASGKVQLHYFVTNANNQTTQIATDEQDSIPANGEITFSHDISTLNLAGNNQLSVVLVQLNAEEPIDFNNNLIKSFFVETDNEAPTFTITFDGVALPHDPEPVVNIDNPVYPYISAQPTIDIELKDSNQDRLLTDPNLLQLTLNGVIVSLLNNPEVVFVPASASNNTAKLVFTPSFIGQDGTFTLTLKGRDVAGNMTNFYQTHFRVQSKMEVENLYPYPNPMVNATTFAFQLRGANPALIEDFRIRIFTLSGRLIYEMDLLNEPWRLTTGALQMNWNKVRWDGTDHAGDIIPTGTYLYKVYLKAEGENLTTNNANSLERLVIIR